MGSDAIANARVSAYNNKSAEKKRGSKLAKLKSDKVDVRTQRQVSKNELNVKKNKVGGAQPASIPKGRDGNRTRGSNPGVSARKHEHQIILPITYDRQKVSWKNDSIVRRSDRDNSKKNCYEARIRRCSDSCSSSCSEGGDGCLDDWEAVADALTAEKTSDLENNALQSAASGVECRYQRRNRAWSPDDVYRPRSLPSVLKQQYNQTQLNPERCFSRGSVVFSWQNLAPHQQQQQQQQQPPSACPICCEDFDVTDSSFQPCPCGFRVCLFCHKKILEVDGRCPGCRKIYGSEKTDLVLPVQTTHSCSKNNGVL